MNLYLYLYEQILAAEFEWGSIDNIKSVFDVNVFGVIRVTREFLPLIRKSKGRIVNMGSIAGRFTYTGYIEMTIK